MKLLDIQDKLSQCIFNSNSNLDLVKSDKATLGLSIYRQSITHNLSRALSILYPGIWKLLGNECANHLAWLFILTDRQLPKCRDLHNWGRNFVDFISQQSSLSQLPYLSDYAMYEWLMHQSYLAKADKPLVEINQSVHILKNLKLTFISSVNLMSSVFPLRDIQFAVENPDFNVNLTNHESYLLISRPHLEIQTHWLEQPLFDFIQLIKSGKTLYAAFEQILDTHPQFDINHAIHFLIKEELLAD